MTRRRLGFQWLRTLIGIFLFGLLTNGSALGQTNAEAEIVEPDSDIVVDVGVPYDFLGQGNNYFNCCWYWWDFDEDDNDDAFVANPQYTFPTAGTYLVRFWTANRGSGSFLRMDSVTVIAVTPPELTITSPANSDSIEVNDFFNFTAEINDPDGDTPGPYTIDWTVTEDDDPMNTRSFSGLTPGLIQMTQVGVYVVEVTASYTVSGLPHQTSTTIVVTVASAPTANIDSPAFDSDPDKLADVIIEPGQSVTFESTLFDNEVDVDGSVPDSLTINWNFDGGATNSSVEDPGPVTFNTLGTYDVALEVEDSYGLPAVPANPGVNPLTRRIIVSTVPDGTIRVNGTFDTVFDINEGEILDFEGGVSDPDAGDFPSFLWEFRGPANQDMTVQNPGNVQFNDPGVYTVTLTVTDSTGLSDPTPPQVTVNVNDRPVGTIVAPVSNVVIAPNQSVNFQGQGTDTDGTIASYAWDFDGGAAASNLQNPGSVMFTAAGSYDVTLTVTDDDGAEDLNPPTVNVTVSTPPEGTIVAPADGTLVALNGFLDFQSMATDADGDTNFTYLWQFTGPQAIGDRTEANPIGIQFTQTGIYTATLTVTDSLGISDPTPALVTFTVTGPPNGTIVSPVGNQVIGRTESLNFQASATDPDGNLPITYAWDFGGGATNQNVEDPGDVAFANNGLFTVAMTATDSLGFPDPTPASISVRVSDRPDGTIVSPATPVVTIIRGGQISFQASGVDPDDSLPLAYLWDFGGGATPTLEQNPTVTFDTSGVFTVGLTVSDSFGLSDIERPEITVRVTDAPDGTIMAPTDDPAVVVTGESLTFQGNATDADDTTPLTYLWDFGGGATNSTELNPGAVLFGTSGNYNVSFTVTDGFGVPDQDVPSLQVVATDRPDGTIAEPVDSQVTLVTGQTVTFSATATDPDDSQPFSFLWNFNGGATDATTQNPGAVAFNTPGVFDVAFTVTDAHGVPDDTPPTRQVRVTDRPTASIDFPAENPVTIGIDESVVFNGTGTDPDEHISTGMTYLWNFDGVAPDSSLEDPGAVTFDAIGEFDVTLSVTDGFGIESIAPATRTVRVSHRPVGTITTPTSETIINPGETVSFSSDASDQDNNTPFTFLWDFGGGADDSTVEDPGEVAFADPGRYQVSFTVTDQLGLDDLTPDLARVIVNDPPVGTMVSPTPSDFIDNGGELVLSQGLDLNLSGLAIDLNTDSGLGTNETFTHTWEIQGPVPQNLHGAAPGQITFETPGIYVLTYRVTDDRGAVDPNPPTLSFRVNGVPDGQIVTPSLDLILNPGESVDFDGEAADSDGDTPLQLSWDFDIAGHPGSSEEDPAGVVFADPGVYRVTFSVADSLGSLDPSPAARTVTVNDPPVISNLLPEPDAGVVVVEAGFDVDFSVNADDPNTASGLPPETDLTLDMRWDFGTLGSSTLADPPPLRFQDPGSYPVSFTVTDSLDAQAVENLTVIADQRPNGVIQEPIDESLLVNLNDSVTFESAGSDPDNPPPGSLTFHWDFGGGSSQGTSDQQNPGAVPFDRNREVGFLQFRVSLTVRDEFNFEDATPDLRFVEVNRPPTGIRLNVIASPGSVGSANPLVLDLDDNDLGLHAFELQSQPALGTVQLFTPPDVAPTFELTAPGNPRSTDPNDYGVFPFDVRVTDPHGLVVDTVGVALIMPSDFSTRLEEWPDTPIIDCDIDIGNPPDPDGCPDFVRGLEIDTLVEIVTAPHLTRNVPPELDDDYFTLQQPLSNADKLLDVLDGDTDTNGDPLTLLDDIGNASLLGASVTVTGDPQQLLYEPGNAAGFDFFTYRVVEEFPGGSQGEPVEARVFVRVLPDADNDACSGARLLDWVPGDAAVSDEVDGSSYTDTADPQCKAQFNDRDSWWAIYIPEDVDAVGFTVDTVPPGSGDNYVFDTVLEAYVAEPDQLSQMCADGNLGFIACNDNISAANFRSSITIDDASQYAGKVLVFLVDSVLSDEDRFLVNFTTN
ncbi:PKD domain-containing protein [Sulfidibacter corallicola]|uniref:PKD domain-containing protein n=1 Tax=Sulfidibacter corallicola TaxID=2818388 RepID=A0A8A4TUU4_SULCO|nr:PKD domain-containing protein [Sulfidibacter corallicola]QTD53127.1 PKD domain-containing protein [Sulfidibacter corallicola]